MLILIAALGGAFVGAMASGGFLLLSQHLQAKRDNQRRQLDFERAIRSEPLEQIKHAVDLGVAVITSMQMSPSQFPPIESIRDGVYQYAVAVNGARVSARAIGAQQVLEELATLSSLTARIEVGSADSANLALMVEAMENLARIESHYIELKTR